MVPRILFFSLVAVLISFVSVHNLFSKNEPKSGPHFTDIIVTTSDTHLLLFGELRNSLTDEMIEGLHNGIPVKFSFFVKLERNEDNWPDEELAMLEFTHSLTYDTLKATYVVQTEETSKRKHTSQDLSEATRILNEINGLKIIELGSLRPENAYRLKVKADIYKKTLPMSLHTIIPFVSWWDLNTDWYSVEFVY